VRLAEFRRPLGQAPEIIRAAPVVERGSTAFNDRHRVQNGEHLSGIALRYGVSVAEILGVNPRLQPDRIVAGQWIELPVKGGS